MAGSQGRTLRKVWDCGCIMRPEKLKSTVMFEAFGCGKPFVGTKVGGVPEIITSDGYGFLVYPANPEELAEQILTALGKEWDSDKILAHSRRFTWENSTEEILAGYTKDEAHAYKTELVPRTTKQFRRGFD